MIVCYRELHSILRQDKAGKHKSRVSNWKVFLFWDQKFKEKRDGIWYCSANLVVVLRAT